MSFRAVADKIHHFVMEQLTVTGLIFVPNHEVDRQPLETPVRVGADELLDQVNLVLGGNPHQDDRQVARDSIPPQARLAAAVLDQDAGVGRRAWRK